MSRSLLLILGAIGATLILLLINDERGMTLGLANDKFAQAMMLGVWGVVLAAGFLRRGMRLGDVAQQAAIWLVILFGLVAGYQYRFELQDIASRISAGLIPSRPQTIIGGDGATAVIINKSNNGHFQVDGVVNGKGVSFLIDTGASDVVLTMRDAEASGFKPEDLSFTNPISTANGDAMAASIRLNEISIGGISRSDIRASVAENGKLDQSLLGMSFLSSLSGYTVRQDELLLQN